MLLALLELTLDSVAQDSGWLNPGFVDFAQGSSRLTDEACGKLLKLGEQMQANPDFKVIIEGNCISTLPSRRLSWIRVNAVIQYLVDTENIDRSRFIFKYQSKGWLNAVFFREPDMGDEGPSRTAMPVR